MNILHPNNPEATRSAVKQFISYFNVDTLGNKLGELRMARDLGHISTGAYYLALYHLHMVVSGYSTPSGDDQSVMRNLSPEMADSFEHRGRYTEEMMCHAHQDMFGIDTPWWKDYIEDEGIEPGLILLQNPNPTDVVEAA